MITIFIVTAPKTGFKDCFDNVPIRRFDHCLETVNIQFTSVFDEASHEPHHLIRQPLMMFDDQNKVCTNGGQTMVACYSEGILPFMVKNPNRGGAQEDFDSFTAAQDHNLIEVAGQKLKGLGPKVCARGHEYAETKCRRHHGFCRVIVRDDFAGASRRERVLASI